MAEAFARIHGTGMVEPASAGSRPSGHVNPRAVAAMLERGYDLSPHISKSLQELGPGPWDYLVTMGCGDECPWIAATHREDWELADPRDLPPPVFNAVRDEIEQRVLGLIRRVRTTRQQGGVPSA